MFWSILTFFLVLSILVLVHEFGHFIVAKKNGIWVEEFGFGLPPRVFGKKIGDTIYSVNLLPFGGFVRLHGEMTDDGVTKPKMAFLGKSLWVKTAVIISGVVMNFLLAIFAFSIVYFFTGIPRETKEVKIISVAPDSPALNAKLIVGDVIKKVDGKEVTNVSGFVAEIEDKKGKKVTLELQDRKVVVTPRVSPPEGQGPLGVSLSTIEIYYPPIIQRPFYGVYYGFKDSIFWSKNVVKGFASIFTDLYNGHAPKDISGPVGVFAVTTEAAKTGILSLINLVGIISVNLAILNIIPFPALDGGRLLFIIIEAIFGKKVAPKIESVIHSIGMFILLALILLITIGDVKRLIEAGSISNFINSFSK
jgi:regulator of sigma E protease